MHIDPSITLLGDKFEAKRLVGFAKGRLDSLVNAMSFAGLKQDRSVSHIQPGIIITCKVYYNIRKILIYVRPGLMAAKKAKLLRKTTLVFYWYAYISGDMVYSYPMAVFTDAYNRIYIAGSIYDSTVHYNAFLGGYTKKGGLFRQKTIGANTVLDFGTNVIVDSDGYIYLLFDAYSERSDTYYDVCLAKYSPDWELQWQRDLGITTTSLYSVGIDISSSDIHVSGWLHDYNVGSQPERYQGFLLKLSKTDGSTTWQRRVGGYDTIGPPDTNDKYTFLEDMSLDLSDNIYSIGTFWYGSHILTGAPLFIKLNSSGTFQWCKHFTYTSSGSPANTMKGVGTEPATDGIYTLCIEIDPSSSSAGVMNTIVTKINSSGVIMTLDNDGVTYMTWMIPVPYTNSETIDDAVSRIAIDDDGNIYTLTNTYETAEGVILTKHDSRRNLQWQRKIVNSAYNGFSIPAIDIDRRGDIVLFGSVDGDADFMIIKLPGSGIFLGTKGDLTITDPSLTITNLVKFTIDDIDSTEIEVQASSFTNTVSSRTDGTSSYSNKTTRILKRESVETVRG